VYPLGSAGTAFRGAVDVDSSDGVTEAAPVVSADGAEDGTVDATVVLAEVTEPDPPDSSPPHDSRNPEHTTMASIRPVGRSHSADGRTPVDPLTVPLQSGPATMTILVRTVGELADLHPVRQPAVS